MADCGLRRVAALTGLERIVDCTLGTLRRKGPSMSPGEQSTMILGDVLVLLPCPLGSRPTRQTEQSDLP
eukprot:297634-Alexandrium_andersonii.AAC.1